MNPAKDTFGDAPTRGKLDRQFLSDREIASMPIVARALARELPKPAHEV